MTALDPIAPTEPQRPSAQLPSEKLALSAEDRRESHRSIAVKGETAPDPGCGTREQPFVVDWATDDPKNPYNWSKRTKWLLTFQLSLGTFSVAFGSSCYTGGIKFVRHDLHIRDTIAILGLSLYVLGFGLGPLVFAPMSEVFGRRPVFLATYLCFTLCHLGGALGGLGALLATRLLAGTFGSSTLSNVAGSINDIWTPKERGVAAVMYALAPFLGPAFGPLVGGFISDNPRLGWRWEFWLMFILSSCILISGFFIHHETYAPALLRKRAQTMTRASDGTVYYISKYDVGQHRSLAKLLRKSLSRPFEFLLTEPIVALIAIYVSIAYAILYSFFASFPIVFQAHRHFTAGEGGLAFLGTGGGFILGTGMAPIANRLYWRDMRRSPTGRAPPESRLYIAMIGAIMMPIGIFWFAWTSQPSVPWIVPILAGLPFGFGVAQIMQSLVQYMMDAYGLYCASAIAATVVLRSITAMAFPLLIPGLFAAIGPQWAISIFGFMAAVCMPIPLLFWKYGYWLRRKSRFAQQD